MRSLSRHAKLDQFTLDIEFLLISVVQGVALSVLATSSIEPISQLDLAVIPYIISAFLLLFIYWSQAIIHAISFIDWPLDLPHNFLYFLASFVQVLSFSKVGDPLHWFAFSAGLFGVGLVLYYVDYHLILNRKAEFEESKSGKALYNHIVSGHLFEMRYLVPAGFIFNVIVACFIWKQPDMMLTQNYHLYAIAIQVLFLAGVLMNSIKSFKSRSLFIENIID